MRDVNSVSVKRVDDLRSLLAERSGQGDGSSSKRSSRAKRSRERGRPGWVKYKKCLRARSYDPLSFAGQGTSSEHKKSQNRDKEIVLLT